MYNYLQQLFTCQAVESVIVLPKGVKSPGCEKTDKEYFMTAGAKGEDIWELHVNFLCLFWLGVHPS